MKPRTTEHMEPVEAGRGKEGLSPRALKSTALPTSRFEISGLQNYNTIRFCCFKPPTSW